MKPLQDFYSFKTYASREDFEKQNPGVPLEPWNPNLPLKYWADKNPTNTDFDELAGEVATYKPVLSVLPNGRYREGADGQPTVGSMRLPIEQAKNYNFPPPKGIFPVVGEILPYGTETNDAFGTPVAKSTKVTAAHIANSQKVIQVPLNLPEGSKVVYAPGIGANAAVLMKGETLPGAPASTCRATEIDYIRLASLLAQELKRQGFPTP